MLQSFYRFLFFLEQDPRTFISTSYTWNPVKCIPIKRLQYSKTSYLSTYRDSLSESLFQSSLMLHYYNFLDALEHYNAYNIMTRYQYFIVLEVVDPLKVFLQISQQKQTKKSIEAELYLEQLH